MTNENTGNWLEALALSQTIWFSLPLCLKAHTHPPSSALFGRGLEFISFPAVSHTLPNDALWMVFSSFSSINGTWYSNMVVFCLVTKHRFASDGVRWCLSIHSMRTISFEQLNSWMNFFSSRSFFICTLRALSTPYFVLSFWCESFCDSNK